MASVEQDVIEVLVAHGRGPRQVEQVALSLPVGSTLAQALQASGLMQRPGMSLDEWVVGIWGKSKPLDTVLRDRDRVELWRGLQVDPKEARRQRYRKQAKPAAA